MNNEFPDVIYAVKNILGETFYFKDLKRCPVTYDEKIEITLYHRGGSRILKRSYEVLEFSSDSKDEDVNSLEQGENKMQKYVIVDIHQEDAFGEGTLYKERLLGQICTVKGVLHNTVDIPDYVGGTVKFQTPVDLSDGNEPDQYSDLYFYAVQLQTLEDNLAENGKIVTVEEK